MDYELQVQGQGTARDSGDFEALFERYGEIQGRVEVGPGRAVVPQDYFFRETDLSVGSDVSAQPNDTALAIPKNHPPRRLSNEEAGVDTRPFNAGLVIGGVALVGALVGYEVKSAELIAASLAAGAADPLILMAYLLRKTRPR